MPETLPWTSDTPPAAGRAAPAEMPSPTPPAPCPCVPVLVRQSGLEVEGYTEAFTPFGAVIQSLSVLPHLEGECELVFDLPLGAARAEARLLAVNAEQRTFEVEI